MQTSTAVATIIEASANTARYQAILYQQKRQLSQSRGLDIGQTIGILCKYINVAITVRHRHVVEMTSSDGTGPQKTILVQIGL